MYADSAFFMSYTSCSHLRHDLGVFHLLRILFTEQVLPNKVVFGGYGTIVSPEVLLPDPMELEDQTVLIFPDGLTRPPRVRVIVYLYFPDLGVRLKRFCAATRQPGPMRYWPLTFRFSLERFSEFYHDTSRCDRRVVQLVESLRLRALELCEFTVLEMRVSTSPRVFLAASGADDLAVQCTEGVVGLTQWFEKMESVFSISNYTTTSQVKFATCTLQDDALTWWNAHVKTTTPEAAHAMLWATLKKIMTDKYCPRATSFDVFQAMFPEDDNELGKKYIVACNDMIHGSVKASNPKTMQEAIEFTTELMDEKTHAYVERQAERKRKYDDLSKNNQNQQNKRQNTGQAYTTGNSDRKPYAGSKPLCSKCNYNHEGPCPPKCSNCRRVGHATKDCRIRPANNKNRNNNNNNNNRNNNNNNRNNHNNNQQGNGCFECGAQGHFKKNYPKLNNNDRDLPGLPPTRQVEFQIDLILGAAPVAGALIVDAFRD
ncbi:putative reverse transcriptase domain-containing protein [Tanacetum coccineum]